MQQKTVKLNTTNKIELFQFLTRRSALGLELKGLGRRGQSAYSICKQAYGLKGSKQSVYDQMSAIREQMQQAINDPAKVVVTA